LNGTPVTFKEGNKREMHFILKQQRNKVNGLGECRSFTGTYITRNWQQDKIFANGQHFNDMTEYGK